MEDLNLNLDDSQENKNMQDSEPVLTNAEGAVITGQDEVAGLAPEDTTPEVTKIPVEDEENVVADIEAELTEKAQTVAHDETKPMGETTLPFDPSKLSPEQLANLKAMLNATPDRAQREKQKPTLKLRVIDGKVVTNIGTAYVGLKYDSVKQSEKEATFIPVKFLGDDKETKVEYKDFMKAERITCTIIKDISSPRTIQTGEQVRQRETGKWVELEYTVMDQEFVVELPAMYGKQLITIGVNIANA